MALHEMYIGGPPSANYSRAMFPSAPFNAGSKAMQEMRVAAHKGPTSYGLTRVFDTSHHAVAEYLREHELEQGDVIGAILIPKNVLLKGFFYSVETPAGEALTITPSLRGTEGEDGEGQPTPAVALPEIDGNTAGRGFAKPGGTAWVDETGAVDGSEYFVAEPTIVDLTLTTFTELGPLRLIITPLVDTLYHGQV